MILVDGLNGMSKIHTHTQIYNRGVVVDILLLSRDCKNENL